MGQYYSLVNVSKDKGMSPGDYGSGIKMGEHSQVGDSFLYEVFHLLKDEWKGDVFYHSGDYAEGFPENISPTRTKYMGGILEKVNYNDDDWFEKEGKKIEDEKPLWEELCKTFVLVNYDLDLYCDIDGCPKRPSGWHICPLPLLLCDSDVIAGGDLVPYDFQYKNSWAYTRIGLELKDSPLLASMKKMVYDF